MNLPRTHRALVGLFKCSEIEMKLQNYAYITASKSIYYNNRSKHDNRLVESSCEKVVCDKQRSRCVHGTCVPLKTPWKLGHVCSQSPCDSASMICVDDIGCFDAPTVSFSMDRPSRGREYSRVKRNEHAEQSTLGTFIAFCI